MPQRITYYYALASGFAYLGEPELQRIARLAGAEIDYRPVDIQKVFAASGTTPPAVQASARRAYRDQELARFAKRRGLPLNVKPRYWPAPVELASRAVLTAQALEADAPALSFAFLRAVWAEDRNIADPATVAAIVGEAAPVEKREDILSLAADAKIASLYESVTEEAIAAGVFGSPTYVLGDEMFFGQDRLDLLAEALGLRS